MARVSALLLTALVLAPESFVVPQEVKLSIDNCPSVLSGAAGETMTFDAFVKLTTANNQGSDGAMGWSVSVAVTGGTVKAVTVQGVVVDTHFNEDEDYKTPPVLVPLDLGTAAFKFVQKATGDYPFSHIPGAAGVVSAIVLDQSIKRVLPPNGAENILRLTIEAVIPPAGEVGELKISFLDGLKGTTGKPVPNVVTLYGASHKPATEDCTISLRGPTPEFILALIGKDQDVGAIPADGGPALLDRIVPAGVEQTIDVHAVLSTAGLHEGGGGPQGWSVSVANAPGMTVSAVTVKGMVVDTLFDHDEDGATPLEDVPLDLATADFKVAQKATGDYDGSPVPGTSGVVSAIVLNNTIKRVLKANQSNRVALISFRVPPLDVGAPFERTVDFLDGLQGAGKPVSNVITFGGASQKRLKNESQIQVKKQGLRIRLTPAIVDPFRFLRGDANADGTVDLADAVTIVYAVVPSLGGPPIVCREAGDADAGGEVNLADAVRLIDYQFRGGLAPPGAFPSCEFGDDATDRDCDCFR